jgi:hypothetical protein
MAVLEFPVVAEGVEHYIFELPLDGIVYRLKFKYNSREDTWYFNILDVNNRLLRAGMKVVNQWELFRLWAARTGRPEGELVTVNVGAVTAPPSLNQLGREVVLTYNEGA